MKCTAQHTALPYSYIYSVSNQFHQRLPPATRLHVTLHFVAEGVQQQLPTSYSLGTERGRCALPFALVASIRIRCDVVELGKCLIRSAGGKATWKLSLLSPPDRGPVHMQLKPDVPTAIGMHELCWLRADWTIRDGDLALTEYRNGIPMIASGHQMILCRACPVLHFLITPRATMHNAQQGPSPKGDAREIRGPWMPTETG